ncbi:MAG: hypothetical protein CM1200mP2_51800 [Planctomycetaceae bacterium]|nr:MAG: hypothetical protein CM1200mP2_51800 [Planctomycetaceae bacterium]
MVLAEHQQVVNQHRRTACTELILKRPHLLPPLFFAIQVVADQSETAEEHVDPLAITRRSRNRRAPRRMRLLDPLRLQHLLPSKPSGSPVQRHGGQLLRFLVPGCQHHQITVNAGGRNSRRDLLPPHQLLLGGELFGQRKRVSKNPLVLAEVRRRRRQPKPRHSTEKRWPGRRSGGSCSNLPKTKTDRETGYPNRRTAATNPVGCRPRIPRSHSMTANSPLITDVDVIVTNPMQVPLGNFVLVPHHHRPGRTLRVG